MSTYPVGECPHGVGVVPVDESLGRAERTTPPCVFDKDLVR